MLHLLLPRHAMHAPGEFGQELRLLGADYRVHECRAALSHLRASGLAGAAYASFVDLLLQFRCVHGKVFAAECSHSSCVCMHSQAGQQARLCSGALARTG